MLIGLQGVHDMTSRLQQKHALGQVKAEEYTSPVLSAKRGTPIGSITCTGVSRIASACTS